MEIKVLCEFEKRRFVVGTLKFEKGCYEFAYELSWLSYKNTLPIGPDLALQSKTYRSRKLFESFELRLPPRNSENYQRYCEERGISTTETNKLILLGTVGHMGPSSFVFELDKSKENQAEVLKYFTKLIKIYSYEIIATAFGVNKTGLYKIITAKVLPQNSVIYNILEICYFNRTSAVWKIKQTPLLPDRIKSHILKHL